MLETHLGAGEPSPSPCFASCCGTRRARVAGGKRIYQRQGMRIEKEFIRLHCVHDRREAPVGGY